MYSIVDSLALFETVLSFFLVEGTTEAELNDIETQIGCKLPDDYRCSYRIHNGQKLVIPGSVSGVLRRGGLRSL